VGLEQVPDAVEHMYAGKNIGKVTVRIGDWSIALYISRPSARMNTQA
jgi:hypothetical protein